MTVLAPLLAVSKGDASDLVAKEVDEGLSAFVANVQIMQGHARGTTALPLPPDWAVSKNTTASSGAPEGPADSKDAIHALESAIITWTKQIKAVLKEDPEGLSTDERPHPGPVAELDFWAAKSKNLDSIFDQLQSVRVRKVLRCLDKAQSTYNAPFAKLCNAVMLERRKFGAQGRNMHYPFAVGDLINSASVLKNYMENAPTKVPWDDLRYLFGEIMYGGHIVNDFDRLVCQEYLRFYMKDELLDEMDMYPYPDVKLQYFAAPQTSDSFDKVLQHVEQTMQGDSPLAFGFHPNAEIGFRTDQSEQLCLSILDLGAGDEASGEEGASKQTVAESALQDILENHRDAIFDIDAVLSLLDEPGPYHTVFLQECELMNALIETMLATLEELDLGFKGELTMGDHMERLQDALFLDRVPGAWSKVAYPSIRGLTTWLANLKGRLEQLREWTQGPTDIPVVTWLSGLFNPTSFLTAVMQTTAQAQSLELDKLRVATEVTKRMEVTEFSAHSRDGAYVYGLSLEGARWDMQGAMLAPSAAGEMTCAMPVINCKAAPADKTESNIYECPCYKHLRRGPTYVFSAPLKTKAPAAKWVLAGTALIMDVATK